MRDVRWGAASSRKDAFRILAFVMSTPTNFELVLTPPTTSHTTCYARCSCQTDEELVCVEAKNKKKNKEEALGDEQEKEEKPKKKETKKKKRDIAKSSNGGTDSLEPALVSLKALDRAELRASGWGKGGLAGYERGIGIFKRLKSMVTLPSKGEASGGGRSY